MEQRHEVPEEIKELIREYGLDEDEEHVIINLKNTHGNARRIYLLKRSYMRIIRHDGTFTDYPLRNIVKALIRYPHLKLSESLPLLESSEKPS